MMESDSDSGKGFHRAIKKIEIWQKLNITYYSITLREVCLFGNISLLPIYLVTFFKERCEMEKYITLPCFEYFENHCIIFKNCIRKCIKMIQLYQRRNAGCIILYFRSFFLHKASQLRHQNLCPECTRSCLTYSPIKQDIFTWTTTVVFFVIFSVDAGVPQGSILSPALFLLIIIDLIWPHDAMTASNSSAQLKKQRILYLSL